MKLVCSMPLTTFTSVNTGKPPAASAAAALVDDPNPPPLSPPPSSSSKSAASSLGRTNPAEAQRGERALGLAHARADPRVAETRGGVVRH